MVRTERGLVEEEAPRNSVKKDGSLISEDQQCHSIPKFPSIMNLIEKRRLVKVTIFLFCNGGKEIYLINYVSSGFNYLHYRK